MYIANANFYLLKSTAFVSLKKETYPTYGNEALLAFQCVRDCGFHLRHESKNQREYEKYLSLIHI